MARALKARIDISALNHNLQEVRNIAPNQSILAMVKANGYGHGIITVAKALEKSGVDALGVACIDEAIVLRNAGIKARIVLMEGFFHQRELHDIVHYQLEPVLHHDVHLKILETTKLNSISPPLRVWVKINTGMHRLGFAPTDMPRVFDTLDRLQKNKIINTIAGLMTHFAKADELHSGATEKQIALFQKTLANLKYNGPVSLCNSAGIMAWQEAHGDWVRPGIMLYGVTPFADSHGALQNLKPVMTLQSEIIAIQMPKQNDAIGYGGIYVCPKDMRVGIVAIGYGDGYPRLAPNGTPVLVNGARVPLVGRVSMDMLSVDLSDVPNVAVGDPVELWGPALPVEEVARHIGTLGYELLTSLSPRVPFESV